MAGKLFLSDIVHSQNDADLADAVKGRFTLAGTPLVPTWNVRPPSLDTYIVLPLPTR